MRTTSTGADVHPTRTILPIAFAVTAMGITVNTLVGVAQPEIEGSLGLGPGQTELIIAAATAPGILLAPLVGALSDRIGRKPVIVACLLTMGIAGGLAGFASTFEQLLVLRFAQGIGSVGLINLAVVLIADHFEGLERVKWIGRNNVVLTVGIVVNPAIGGVLAGFGWRWVFAPYWLAAVVGVAAWLVLPNTRPPSTGSIKEYFTGAFRYARTFRALALYATAIVLFLLIFGTNLATLPFVLGDDFGLDPALRGLLLGSTGVIAGILSFQSGRLHRRWTPRQLVLAGFVFLSGSYAVLAIAPSLPVFALGLMLFGIGEGVSIPTMQSVSTDLGPEQYRGALVALWVGAARFGQTLGPVLAGQGRATIGLQGTIAVSAVIAAAWAVLGSLVLGRKRRRSVRQPVTGS